MIIDYIKGSLLNLGRKKFRSSLTIAGIAIGVASVVIIGSIGDIGKNTINAELESLGVSGLMIRGENIGQTELDIIKKSDMVQNAMPILMEYSKSAMRGLIADTVIWGIDAGASQIISLEAVYGRLISKSDVSSKEKVCVVDESMARVFYNRDNIVGKKVKIKNENSYEEFTIVGVVASGGNLLQGMLGEYIPSFVYLPYSTMQNMYMQDNFDQIAVKVGGENVDEVGEMLIKKISSGSKNSFKVENMAKQKDKLNNMLNIVTIVLSAIAGISLVVAGLSIMTVMLVSVNERTREIGIKKSIGASSGVILIEFLVEAFTISIIGSVTGSAIGIITVTLGCLPFGIPIYINYMLVGFCIIFSIIMGVVFGVYPASIASKLRPVDALRFE